MKVKWLLFLLLIILTISLMNIIIFGHDNKIIHPFTLTGKAWHLLDSTTRTKSDIPSSSPYYELSQYFHDAMPSGYRVKNEDKYNYYPYKITKQGTLGTIVEDTEFNPEIVSLDNQYLANEVPLVSMLNHFYYVPNGTALWSGSKWQYFLDLISGYENSELLKSLLAQNPIKDLQTYTENKKLWEDSIRLYQEGDQKRAYFKLGRLLHLFQDLSSAPHVFDDAHLTLSKFGYEFDKSYQDSFEQWEENSFAKDNPMPVPPAEQIRQVPHVVSSYIYPEYEDYYKEIREDTFRAIRIQGELTTDNKWDEHPSELKTMFPALTYVLFDLDGITYYKIPELGKYKKYDPDGTFLDICNRSYWWPIDNLENDWYTYYYIEKPRVAIPFSYLDYNDHIALQNKQNPIPYYLSKKRDNPAYKDGMIDEVEKETQSLAALWAGVMKNEDGTSLGYDLIPRTIEYSAGLMKLWYDIVNAPPYVQSVVVSQDNIPVYSASWGDTTEYGVKCRKRKVPISKHVSTDVGVATIMQITFSKEMDLSSIKVGITKSGGQGVLVVTGTLDAATGTIWTSNNINQWPQDSKLSLFDGVQKIHIAGKDTSYHYPRKGLEGYGYYLDSDPKTIATCASSSPYAWSGYEHGTDIANGMTMDAPNASPGQANVDETNAIVAVNGNLDSNVTTIKSKIKILQNGFWKDTKEYFEAIHIKGFELMEDTLLYENLVDTKVLVIPTGGLYGISESPQIKEVLTQYVAGGGNIFCFTQMQGADYNALPVPEDTTLGQAQDLPLQCLGYVNDISCFDASTRIINESGEKLSPVLSGLGTNQLGIAIDGYIRQYPSNGKTILIRRATYYPAYVIYTVGALGVGSQENTGGYVAVTNQYSDRAKIMNQDSDDDNALVRDSIRWLTNTQLLCDTTIPAGENEVIPLSLSVKIKNDGADTTNYIMIKAYNPKADEMASMAYSLTLSPNDSTLQNIDININKNSEPGIWYIGYELQKDSKLIYTNNYAGTFAVRKLMDVTEYNKPDITIAISSDREIYTYGDKAEFTVTIRNLSDSTKTINYLLQMPHHAGTLLNNEYNNVPNEGELVIEGKSEKILNIIAYPVKTQDALWVNITYGNNIKIDAHRGISVFGTDLKFAFKTDKEIYATDKAINTIVTIKSGIFLPIGD